MQGREGAASTLHAAPVTPSTVTRYVPSATKCSGCSCMCKAVVITKDAQEADALGEPEEGTLNLHQRGQHRMQTLLLRR
jgi:hypothetical protein